MKGKIVDDKDTRHVSKLIQIAIPDTEIPKYTSQLNTVLSSVEDLKELNTDEVEGTNQTHGLKNVLREDEAIPGLDMSKYKNDKNFRGGYFVVKKVI
jgi:aspartyl-tRNA(Asn)/glutamyl-tRNA(Gln) amidotransferase subunit C